MHTRDGKPVNVGDTLYLPCKVKSLGTSEEFCNVDVESEFSMPPYEDSKLHIAAVNTRQFLSIEGVVDRAAEASIQAIENDPV